MARRCRSPATARALQRRRHRSASSPRTRPPTAWVTSLGLDSRALLGAVEAHDDDALRPVQVDDARRHLQPADRAANSQRSITDRDSKTTVRDAGGSGWSLKATSVTMASVPNEPTSSLATSKPATFFTTLPPLRPMVPSERTKLAPITRSRGVPNRVRSGPLAAVATHAADGCRVALGRVEHQALAEAGGGCERLLKVASVVPARDDADQVRRLVVDDSLDPRGREHDVATLGRGTPVELGATSASNDHQTARRCCREHGGDLGLVCGRHHEARDDSADRIRYLAGPHIRRPDELGEEMALLRHRRRHSRSARPAISTA